MATTKFTKKSPKKTPRKDIEDAGAPEPPRGKRSPSKGARGQRADTSDADIRHKARGTGKSATGVKRTRTKRPGAAAAEVEAALPEESGGATAKRNAKKRAPKASSELEGSLTDTPSRKSTRGSANRIKAGTELTKRAIRRTSSPEKRAEKAIANAKKTSSRKTKPVKGGRGK